MSPVRAVVLLAPLLTSVASPSVAAPGRGTPIEPVAVVSPADASGLEALAAREVRRYFYVRTGRLLPIEPEAAGPAIAVGRRDRAFVRSADPRLTARLDALAPQERLLVTVRRQGRAALLVTGGDEAGVLYAAYRFAEHLGVRFGLHGDTIPDEKRPSVLPDIDEAGRPLFAIRGIQPFHDFPEGPDWWSRDDYKAVLGAAPQARDELLRPAHLPRGPAERGAHRVDRAARRDRRGERGESGLPLELLHDAARELGLRGEGHGRLRPRSRLALRPGWLRQRRHGGPRAPAVERGGRAQRSSPAPPTC